MIRNSSRSSPPGDCGICGLPDLQRLSEVCGAARKRSTGPADPRGPTVHIGISSQGGHRPNHDAGKIKAQTTVFVKLTTSPAAAAVASNVEKTARSVSSLPQNVQCVIIQVCVSMTGVAH